MKSDDILDAIGMVDEECVKKAKEKQKSKKAVWIAVGSLAACLVLAVSVSQIRDSEDPDGDASAGNAASRTEMAIECDHIWIYYVDGEGIQREKEYVEQVPETIFNVWKEKNGIGGEVRFIDCHIDSNGTTIDEGSTVAHTVGDVFIGTLTISIELADYYNIMDKELLLQSLRQTMTERSNIKYKEFNIVLQ